VRSGTIPTVTATAFRRGFLAALLFASRTAAAVEDATIDAWIYRVLPDFVSGENSD